MSDHDPLACDSFSCFICDRDRCWFCKGTGYRPERPEPDTHVCDAGVCQHCQGGRS